MFTTFEFNTQSINKHGNGISVKTSTEFSSVLLMYTK